MVPACVRRGGARSEQPYLCDSHWSHTVNPADGTGACRTYMCGRHAKSRVIVAPFVINFIALCSIVKHLRDLLGSCSMQTRVIFVSQPWLLAGLLNPVAVLVQGHCVLLSRPGNLIRSPSWQLAGPPLCTERRLRRTQGHMTDKSGVKSRASLYFHHVCACQCVRSVSVVSSLVLCARACAIRCPPGCHRGTGRV